MLKKITIAAIGILAGSGIAIAAQVYQTPSQNDISNNSAWQKTQQEITEAQQQLNAHAAATPQNIQQTVNTIQKQILNSSQSPLPTASSSSAKTAPSEPLQTTPASETKKTEVADTPPPQSTPTATGLPSNDKTNNGSGSGSGWNYGF